MSSGAISVILCISQEPKNEKMSNIDSKAAS
jgi:hypothetical protein